MPTATTPVPQNNQYLEGMEPPTIDALDDAIVALHKAEEKLQEWKDKVDQKKQALEDLLVEHADEIGTTDEDQPLYLSVKHECKAFLVHSESTKVSVRKAPPSE